MKNTRIFKLKYIGASNTKGSRVSIHDLRFGKRRMIPYNHEFNNIGQIAQAYLWTRGITCDIEAETPDGHILGTFDFDRAL